MLLQSHLLLLAGCTGTTAVSSADRSVGFGRTAAPATVDHEHTTGTSSTRGECGAALVRVCPQASNGRSSSIDLPQCELCCGRHQHALRSAGCSAEDCSAYCSAITPRSQYPLLHIGSKLNCSAEGPCTKDDGADGNGRDYPYALTQADAEALGGFSLLHFSPMKVRTVELVHAVAKAPIVKYTETKPVCGGSGGQETPYSSGCNDTFNFETGGFRKDAQVYFAGNLTRSISAADTTLELCLGVPYCCGKYATPLVASTQINGSYSDYKGSKYVTFMRIGEELMKIVEVETYVNPDPEIADRNGKCQRLTVERGLDGSTPRPAMRGAAILAPLYVGTPSWGTGPKASGRLRYQADYQSFYAWSSLSNFTVDAVQQLDYDGAWFDSYSPSEVANGADPGGLKVSIWNPSTQRPYTRREAMDAQKERLQKVWHAVREQLGYYPLIWANNFENWLPGVNAKGDYLPGDVELMEASDGFKPFDGCSLEAWTGSAQKRNGEGGAGCWAQTGDISDLTFKWTDADTWVKHTNSMIDAASRNLSVAAMTESAGCQSQIQAYWPTQFRTQLDLMHYASYLLTVAHAGGTTAATTGPLLGTTAFFAEDLRGDGQPRGMSRAKLWEPYTWDLGEPTVLYPNVTMYDVNVQSQPSVYVRYFQLGAVVVNPTNLSTTSAIDLEGAPYEDRLTGEQGIHSVQMPKHTGRVLLRTDSP